MTVVSDSSPLITLARIRCFDLLPNLYGKVYISTEVYSEVVIDGAGLPGATQASRRYAHEEGLPIIGCVGILEDLYEQGDLSDLRGAYQQLIQHKTRIDLQTLQQSLAKFRLPRL